MRTRERERERERERKREEREKVYFAQIMRLNTHLYFLAT